MKIKTVIKDTYGKTREYKEISSLPEIGDDYGFEFQGWVDAKVKDVVCVNDEVAVTSDGDPKREYDFYRIDVLMDNDIFEEYVCVEGGWDIGLDGYIKKLRRENYSDESIKEFSDFLDGFGSFDEFEDVYDTARWFWTDAEYDNDRLFVREFYSKRDEE